MASLGLGSNAPRAAAPLRPERITAGADFANPVVVSTPVRPVSPPPKVAAAPRAALPAAAPASGAWRIQLGAFGVAGNAQALWAKLKGNAALGARQAFYVPAGKLTKLQSGPFASRSEAQAACAGLGVQACIPVG